LGLGPSGQPFEHTEPARLTLPDPQRVGYSATQDLLLRAYRLSLLHGSAPLLSLQRSRVIPTNYQLVPVALALEPGGILLSCSCSGAVSLDDLLFQYPRSGSYQKSSSSAAAPGAILPSAAQRVGRKVQLLEVFGHGFDHPINLAMPETAYLKAVFCHLR
jgi:hypothetical protein